MSTFNQVGEAIKDEIAQTLEGTPAESARKRLDAQAQMISGWMNGKDERFPISPQNHDSCEDMLIALFPDLPNGFLESIGVVQSMDSKKPKDIIRFIVSVSTELSNILPDDLILTDSQIRVITKAILTLAKTQMKDDPFGSVTALKLAADVLALGRTHKA